MIKSFLEKLRLTRDAEQMQERLDSDKQQLLDEIRKAHKEWQLAQTRFDYVVEKEQIDYAIFALEAAEKRFEMLLKQGKSARLTAFEPLTQQAAGG